MQAVLQNDRAHPQLWTRAIEAKYAGRGAPFTREDWDMLLGSSQACCDIPSTLFSVELAEAYPEAKVIILNRDPESWYESVLHSVYKVTGPPATASTIRRMLRGYTCLFDAGARDWFNMMRKMNELAFGYDHGEEKKKALDWYSNIYQEFRDNIPAERRIEYHIRDGWGPLCEYLDVPVPLVKDRQTGRMVEAPFPHANDRAEFNSRVLQNKGFLIARAHQAMFSFMGRMAVMGVVGYVCYLLWKTRPDGWL